MIMILILSLTVGLIILGGGHKKTRIKLPPINTYGHICTLYDYNPVDKYQAPIELNHYLIKSLEEYKKKKLGRTGATSGNLYELDYFYRRDKYACYPNYNAYKYLIKLKQAMHKNSIITK